MGWGCEVSPAETSIQSLVLWAAALTTLANFAILIWGIFSGPSRRNASKLEDHGRRLEAHDLRISAIEQSQSSLPTRENMHELELAMEQLKGQMQVMSQKLAGYSDIMTRVENVVARHEEHLLKAK